MEKINIAELLKNCPKGMELDCTIYNGKVYFDGFDYDNIAYPIKISINSEFIEHLNIYGQYNTRDYAKCVIFPKGKTTWEGFQRPFKNGDIVRYSDAVAIFNEWDNETLIRTHVATYLNVDSIMDIAVPLFGKSIKREIRFATEEEKERLFQAIKANGYKWNAKTKTLEKLITPKFKVGDKIKNKYTNEIGVVLFVSSNGDNGGQYDIAISNEIGKSIDIATQDDWELVPNKFDINTLVPFESKVLVRDSDREKWKPNFWGFYDIDNAMNYPYECCGASFAQCIPYEGNEHLLGKIDDCNEFYKNWT